MPKKGLFVTLEGPDGSGKSTQLRLLAGKLRGLGREVVETREPGGSPLAEKIRDLLLDAKNHGLRNGAELLLFEAARFQHVEDTIRPALERGAVVLCDRFTDSTLAYQGAGRNISQDQVQWLNRFATSKLEPDLTLVYDLSVEDGLTRAKEHKQGTDRMEDQDLDFHRRVRAAFQEMAQQAPDRVQLISAGQQDAAAVAEIGLAAILKRLA